MKIDQLEDRLNALAEELAAGEERFEPVLGQDGRPTGALLYVYRTPDDQRTVHVVGRSPEECYSARQGLLKWTSPVPEVPDAS